MKVFKLGVDALARPCVEVYDEDEEYTIPFTDEQVKDKAVDVFIEQFFGGMPETITAGAKTAFKTYAEYYGIERFIEDYSDEIAEALYKEKVS